MAATILSVKGGYIYIIMNFPSDLGSLRECDLVVEKLLRVLLLELGRIQEQSNPDLWQHWDPVQPHSGPNTIV